MRTLLQGCLVIVAFLLVCFSWSCREHWWLVVGFIAAATDLICTVRGKPLIGMGPLAKFLYPDRPRRRR
jgi:hypothetical protein